MKTSLCRTMRVCLVMLLISLGGGCSTFQLASTPGADIYENGDLIAHTPYRFKLISGNRILTLKRFGYVEEEVKVSSLDRKKLHVDLQWIGKTRIDTQPQGAEVVRIGDGEIIGTTPCSLYLSRPDRVVLKLKGFEWVERHLTPNRSYEVELKLQSGFRAAFYRNIMFVSDQGAVEIYDQVAGESIGITPARLRVKAGAALEYRLSGHRGASDLITRTTPPRVLIELQEIVRVTMTGPEGALVYRAGGLEKIGSLPFTVEVEGSALYEIKKEGYYDRSIAIAPASPSLLNIELKEIPYKTILSDPPGADIYRLGGLEKLGTAPFRTIVKEERIFEIKKKGYRSAVIGMGPSSPAMLSVPLSPVPRDEPYSDSAAVGVLSGDMLESF